MFDFETPTVETKKPAMRVVDDALVVDLSTGKTVRLPLNLKTRVIRAASDKNMTDLEQFFAMLDGIGNEESKQALDDAPIFETTAIVARFFEAFEQKIGAARGE